MADEQVTRGSAGPAQRQPRRRRGPARAADEAGGRPNLDERERNVGPRRKPMGPVVPEERGPDTRAAAADDIPEVPPTDPQ
jgi:hypothetical protein